MIPDTKSSLRLKEVIVSKLDMFLQNKATHCFVDSGSQQMHL